MSLKETPSSKTQISKMLKELEKLGQLPAGDLAAEEANLKKIKEAFESFGESTVAFDSAVTGLTDRISKAKNIYESTNKVMKRFEEASDSAEHSGCSGDTLKLNKIRSFDDELNKMDKRIIEMRRVLANDENHKDLKESLDKYHDTFRNTLKSFKHLGKADRKECYDNSDKPDKPIRQILSSKPSGDDILDSLGELERVTLNVSGDMTSSEETKKFFSEWRDKFSGNSL